jgi:nitrilase
VLAGPLLDRSGVLIADVDVADIVRARFDFDPVGHYARPDIFHLEVDRTARAAVTYQTAETVVDEETDRALSDAADSAVNASAAGA